MCHDPALQPQEKKSCETSENAQWGRTLKTMTIHSWSWKYMSSLCCGIPLILPTPLFRLSFVGNSTGNLSQQLPPSFLASTSAKLLSIWAWLWNHKPTHKYWPPDQKPCPHLTGTYHHPGSAHWSSWFSLSHSWSVDASHWAQYQKQQPWH